MTSSQPSLFDRTPPAPRLSTPYQASSPTSRAAAVKAQAFVGQQGETVLAAIQKTGERGLTQKEAKAVTGIDRPSLAARFNALERCRLIVKTDRKREGCAVYLMA